MSGPILVLIEHDRGVAADTAFQAPNVGNPHTGNTLGESCRAWARGGAGSTATVTAETIIATSASMRNLNRHFPSVMVRRMSGDRPTNVRLASGDPRITRCGC